MKTTRNLIIIANMGGAGPVWWMVCDDATILKLKARWLERYEQINGNTEVTSLFEGAQLRREGDSAPQREDWSEFRMWHVTLRNHEILGYPTYAPAGPTFGVSLEPGADEWDPEDGSEVFSCKTCQQETGYGYAEDDDDVMPRYVRGFQDGAYCERHWLEQSPENRAFHADYLEGRKHL